MKTATKTKSKMKTKANQKQENNIKEQRLQTNVIELYIFPKSCGEW